MVLEVGDVNIESCSVAGSYLIRSPIYVDDKRLDQNHDYGSIYSYKYI